MLVMKVMQESDNERWICSDEERYEFEVMDRGKLMAISEGDGSGDDR